MKNSLQLSVLLFFAFIQLSFAQSNTPNTLCELGFEVKKTYPSLTITPEKLQEAQTLLELNKHDNSSKVKEYVSVEILTITKGETNKTVYNNGVFSQAQKDLLMRADLGSTIAVNIQYIPDNNLKHNDIQEAKFSFVIAPQNDAAYIGGEQQLQDYLKTTAVDKVTAESFKKYDLTAIQFTIDEAGKVVNAHPFKDIYQPFENEKVEAILLNAICNMPDWKPAQYADGTPARQEFVLMVGNMESCVVNLLNIR